MISWERLSYTAVLSAGVVMAAGCGSRHASVSGQVVSDGKPYVYNEKARVFMVFECKEPSLRILSPVTPDGRFSVDGPTNEGVPLGDFTVGYFYDTEDASVTANNLETKDSQLRLDLKGGGHVDVVVDLTKRTLSQ